jgi:hypothetical protein
MHRAQPIAGEVAVFFAVAHIQHVSGILQEQPVVFAIAIRHAAVISKHADRWVRHNTRIDHALSFGSLSIASLCDDIGPRDPNAHQTTHERLSSAPLQDADPCRVDVFGGELVPGGGRLMLEDSLGGAVVTSRTNVFCCLAMR